MRKNKTKARIDLLLVEKGLVKSRQRAQSLIMAGKVMVEDVRVDKPGTLVERSARVVVKQDENPFVSRGGLKLDHALKNLPVSVKNKICLDIGASTGGFTDCLLQYGAMKVYAIDVGYGQFDWTLRQDDRVRVIERTNIRHMPFEALGEKVDVVVADTSFISLKIVLVAAEKFMKENALVLALIKPQFEAGRENVGAGGVVRDDAVRQEAVDKVASCAEGLGLNVLGRCQSPLPGPAGNLEYFILAQRPAV